MRLAPNIDFLPKVVTDVHLNADIVLPDFFPKPSMDCERLWHTLDVTRAIKFYLSRTQFPNEDHQLFVSYTPKTLEKAVSAQRLSHWLVDLISLCYALSRMPPPSSLTAHSTCSMATLVAFAAGVPLQDVCKAATWKNPTTFIRHYALNARAKRQGALGRAVLQYGLRMQPALHCCIVHCCIVHCALCSRYCIAC